MTVLTYLAPALPEALFAALTRSIGARVGRPARLTVDASISGPGPDDPEPFSTGEVDVAFLCATSYVWLRARVPSPVRLAGAAWVPLDPRSDGRPVYFTELAVRADDERVSVSELAGALVACNDTSSLSGYHSLRLELRRRGLAPDHWRTVVTGGHRRSIDLLLAGDVDVAALDSVVLWTQRRARPDVAALRTVAAIVPFPVQPVVVAAGIPDAQADAVRAALLDAHDTDHEALEGAGLSRFVPVVDDDYEDLRAALGAIGTLPG